MNHLVDQILTFVAASIIFVPFFKKIGLGPVMGFLVAGLTVGPYGLGFIKDSEQILHFAEFGVVFLLFLIGLEIHPKKLWQMKNQLIGLGGLQVVVCTLVFMLFAFISGQQFIPSLLIGFAFSLSSTAFAIQNLIEKKLLHSNFGKASFAVLLTQDLLAIPALAFIPVLATYFLANSSSPHLAHDNSSSLSIFSICLALIGLIALSRIIIRPLFRIIASTKMREIFIATALFIVLGVSSLMMKLGLSAGLGTFIAGMLLADSEYRHEIEANLGPFKDLLMGLFFIAVGMGVNLNFILEHPLQILTLSIAYLVVKSILIYVVARICRVNSENALLVALNIGQGGEFAFVIFALAFKTQIITQNLVDLLTPIITLSMVFNSISHLFYTRYQNYKNHKSNQQNEKNYDSIQNEFPQIIIAGFGRFGQIFGRILKAQNIPFVAIDHNAEQVELVRKFGNKVYYGDAGREDILHAAGAENARYFILAIDDIEGSLEVAQSVKKNFPHLKIFARARNRGHVFDLMNLDVQLIKREVFDSALNFVQDLFLDMGQESNKVQKIVERFKRHDELMLEEQFKVRSDDKMFISLSNQGAAQLRQVLQDEETKSYVD